MELLLLLIYKRYDTDKEQRKEYYNEDEARSDFIYMTQEKADEYEYVALNNAIKLGDTVVTANLIDVWKHD